MKALVVGLAAVSVLSLACPALADDADQICADRPGKATPPCLVQPGRWQVETGLADASFTRGGGRDDVYAVGGFELRRGLGTRTELNLAWTPLSIERQVQDGAHLRDTGVGDLQLGARFALTAPGADGFAASLQPFVTAPTATHRQGDGGWEGGLLLPMSVPAPADVSVGMTPEVDLVRDQDGHGAHLAWTDVAALSRPFGPTTLGIELWAQRDADPAGHTTQASFDITAAYVPKARPDLQLDAGVNAGLSHDTPDLEAYVGVSRRF